MWPRPPRGCARGRRFPILGICHLSRPTAATAVDQKEGTWICEKTGLLQTHSKMAASDGLSLPAIASNSVLPFLGIGEKDLPYGGRLKSHSTQGVSPKTVPLPLKGHADDDASHLFSSLTGIKSAEDCVVNAPVRKLRRNRAHSTHARGQGFAEQPTDFNGECPADEEGVQHKEEQRLAPGPVQECPPSEKALDTTDLTFWMYTVVPHGKSSQEEESYSDADSEELERRAAVEKVPERVAADVQGQVDEHTKREEFRARIKESLGFVKMRMEMLQDLSLGEASKDESSVLAGGGGDTSFMSGTSVLVKHARKLAGTLHTEEQAVRLQDLHQWFQNIGKTLGDDALGASQKSSLHNQLDRLRSLNVVKDLYEATEEPKPVLPTLSPYELLRRVEHDVRDRLANLYQGKNFLLSRQADIWANEKSESAASGDKAQSQGQVEETLHGTMERLQKMENTYEMLGTTILENLKEIEKMEEDFHVLQSELVTRGCPLLTISDKKQRKHSSHKGKKKGASSESDGINNGSSPSESSSAPSSSRPLNAQAEETSGGKDGSSVLELPSNRKVAEDKSLEADVKADSKSASKSKKKSFSQKNEKKKGVKSEGKNDGVNLENNKGRSATSAVASTPLQTSSPSVLSPVTETAPLNVAAKEEKGQFSTSASGIGLSNSTLLSEGVVSSTPAVIENVHTLEGAKPLSCDAKGQVVVERPNSLEPPRSWKGEGDLFGVQNKLILPKTSFNVQNGRDVKPSDSASLQTLPKPKRKSRRLSSEVSKDEIVQTDDVAILSLEDCDVDALRLREYQAADVKELLENMRKMQKQLQFWRTKNWAEKHTGQQGHMMPPPVYTFASQFIKVDASPDMGMVCYYNPRTGFHTMKNVSDLETSFQQSIMSLVAGPGQGSPAH